MRHRFPTSGKHQPTPTGEIRFIASYTNGMDIRRNDVFAVDRPTAERLANDRTPHKFRLFNLRMK